MADATIQGFAELLNMVNQLGQVPRRIVRSATRAGASLDLRAARAYAPIGYGYIARKGQYGETGALRSGIVLKEERTSSNGKAVFDIRMNNAKNDIFQKPIKQPGKYGGENSKGYYPTSMEYGFKTAKGHWEGIHYLKNSADSNSDAVKQAIINKALDSIDQVLEAR